MSKARRAGLTIAVVALMAVAGTTAWSGDWSRTAAQGPTAAPEFLRPGHCYRIAFPIDGPPNYKVLGLLEGGWITAEVDAGSAKAQRQPLWINSTQIVTMRETRCSE